MDARQQAVDLFKHGATRGDDANANREEMRRVNP
jgi:hypothetical protein